jgi:hypothetical protein
MADPLNMADDLWAWVTRYPDGSVGLVGAMVPALGMHDLRADRPLPWQGGRSASLVASLHRGRGHRQGDELMAVQLEDGEGASAVALSADHQRKLVMMTFSRRIEYFAMSSAEARVMAHGLLNMAAEVDFRDFKEKG